MLTAALFLMQDDVKHPVFSYIFDWTAAHTVGGALHRTARVTKGAAGVRWAVFVVLSTLSTDLL